MSTVPFLWATEEKHLYIPWEIVFKDNFINLFSLFYLFFISSTTKWYTINNYFSTATHREIKKRMKALSLFPFPKCSGTHIKTHDLPFAKTTLVSLQPVEHKAEIRWIQAPCLSFVLQKQNVNNTRCPGEWLKPNTSPPSICLVSDPFWRHIVILKPWKDHSTLSSVCSAAVMMGYVLPFFLLQAVSMYLCNLERDTRTCLWMRVGIYVQVKLSLIVLLALCNEASWLTCGNKSVSVVTWLW